MRKVRKWNWSTLRWEELGKQTKSQDKTPREENERKQLTKEKKRKERGVSLERTRIRKEKTKGVEI